MKKHLTTKVAPSNGSKNLGHSGWYVGVKKVPVNRGLVVDVAGQRLTWKARGEDTAYIFSMYEMTLLPEKALALHYHPYAEVFYVLDGEVEFGSMKDGREEWSQAASFRTNPAAYPTANGP